MDDELLRGQLDYYRARADEYDEWFLREGRHDRGPERNRRWFHEVQCVRDELDAFGPAGDVLELACGTGLWTVELARHANSITAVDASPEVLEINGARLRDVRPETPIDYVRADIFDWRPERRYDVVFFGFWLSHVPPDRFATFWEFVGSALAPGGRVFFVDSLRPEKPTRKEHVRTSEDHMTWRQLNDGQEFRIVKIYYDPSVLEQRLVGLGWRCSVQDTGNYLLYGSGELRTSTSDRTPAP